MLTPLFLIHFPPPRNFHEVTLGAKPQSWDFFFFFPPRRFQVFNLPRRVGLYNFHFYGIRGLGSRQITKSHPEGYRDKIKVANALFPGCNLKTTSANKKKKTRSHVRRSEVVAHLPPHTSRGLIDRFGFKFRRLKCRKM